MRITKMRSRLCLLVTMALAVAFALPLAAFADSVAIDGDGVSTSNSKNSKFALCPGVGSSVDVYGAISYTGTGNGAKHFANNGTVNITTSVASAASGFITAAGGSVKTESWDAPADSVQTGAMKLDVDTDWVAGTYEVTYTFSGKGQDGKDYVLNDKNNVVISEATSGCGSTGGGENPPPPPSNTAPTVDVTYAADGKPFTDDQKFEIGTTIPAPACSVTDAEDTNESANPQTSALSGTLSAYGLGEQTVTCSYTDGGGLSGTDSVTYEIVDTGLPTISDNGAKTGPDGSNNWYISKVTNLFEAKDNGAGFQTATPKLLSYIFEKDSGSNEGSAVEIDSGSVSDVASNAATAIKSKPFMIDLSNPDIGVTDSNSATTYDVCGSARPTKPSFMPTDAISGIDTANTSDSWTPPSTASGVGNYTYSAQAKDIAGRSASYGPKTYKVSYGDSLNGGSGSYGGVLQPVNGGGTPELTDDNSRFKLGSTVPVKFKLMCGTTPVDNAVAKLNIKKADGTPDPGTDEAVSTAASTTGNLFRYSSADQQYIFNLSTKSVYTNPNGTTVSWAAGTYTLSILLDDGTYRSFNINIVR